MRNMNLEFFQSIALSVSNERSVETVFHNIVDGLAEDFNVVLARIWLIAPGDICHKCYWREVCPDQTKCLHLVASNGRSMHSEKWPTSIKGRYKRFPLYTHSQENISASGKIGYIGGTGNAVLRNDILEKPDWLLDPEWAKSSVVRLEICRYDFCHTRTLLSGIQ